jgi:hypothetical protein
MLQVPGGAGVGLTPQGEADRPPCEHHKDKADT